MRNRQFRVNFELPGATDKVTKVVYIETKITKKYPKHMGDLELPTPVIEPEKIVPLPLGLIALASTIGLAGYLALGKRKKKIFVSYHSKKDSHYKNLLNAWVKNDSFELDFEDVSTDTKINSRNQQYLKRRMKEQIKKSDCVMVFIGESTHKRPWVLWEIEKAKELKKPIIAVKERRGHKSPDGLLGCDATWVIGFSEEKIRNALKTL